MSGTSLDGLDIVFCSFSYASAWSYKIRAFTTVNYSNSFKNKLRNAPNLSPSLMPHLSSEFGQFMAEKLADFISSNSLSNIDLIASHGHTVFHQPDKGITLQIGCPKPIYNLLSIPVVSDFRSQDVYWGGQGAPLVPFVDKVLFNSFNACLNLGGFSNISFDFKGRRVAFDVCPVNIVLNLWASKQGYDYDDQGSLARSGSVNTALLDQLNSLDFYKVAYPKSLGWEWVEEFILPLLNNSNLSDIDVLRTFTEHVAHQLISVFSQYSIQTVLVTGGGTYNTFLLHRIRELTPSLCFEIDSNIIESKEALAFAFLGLMRRLNHINVLSSVTGSVKDHCSGSLYPEDL